MHNYDLKLQKWNIQIYWILAIIIIIISNIIINKVIIL